MEVMQLLGSQGFWQHQVLRELAARAAGNSVLWEANMLQYSCLENPTDREAWQGLQSRKELDRTEETLPAWTQDSFCLWPLCPSEG